VCGGTGCGAAKIEVELEVEEGGADEPRADPTALAEEEEEEEEEEGEREEEEEEEGEGEREGGRRKFIVSFFLFGLLFLRHFLLIPHHHQFPSHPFLFLPAVFRCCSARRASVFFTKCCINKTLRVFRGNNGGAGWAGERIRKVEKKMKEMES
jgi:hypothetical protein